MGWCVSSRWTTGGTGIPQGYRAGVLCCGKYPIHPSLKSDLQSIPSPSPTNEYTHLAFCLLSNAALSVASQVLGTLFLCFWSVPSQRYPHHPSTPHTRQPSCPYRYEPTSSSRQRLDEVAHCKFDVLCSQEPFSLSFYFIRRFFVLEIRARALKWWVIRWRGSAKQPMIPVLSSQGSQPHKRVLPSWTPFKAPVGLLLAHRV